MDSATLLADPTADGRRTAVLKDAAERGFQVRANALAAEEDLLLINLWLGGYLEHFGLIVDSRWMLPASAKTHSREELVTELREQLDTMGYPLVAGEDRPLLADHVAGRRTSVLKDDKAVWELRAKLLFDDDQDEEFIQLRVWYTDRGYLHIVYRTDGTFVAAVRGELARHDIVLS
jgi:hypothetical protein